MNNVVIVVLIVVGVIILRGITIVRQSTVKIVEYLGRYSKTFSPGLHYRIPLLMRVRAMVDTRETICDFEKQTVITKDNVKCVIDGVGFFKIIQPEKAIYAVSDYYNSISQLMMTNLRNVLGQLTLDEAQTSRSEVSRTILHDINLITAAWGIEVTNVEIQSITPPDNIVQAMSLEMEAERKKRSLILESEGEKAATIKRAEAKNRQIIIEAEAEKQKEILEAEAKSEAQRIEALAQKNALDVLHTFMGDKDKAREFVLMKSYIDSLIRMTEGENEKTVFMPYESSELLKAIGLSDGLRPNASTGGGFFAQ